MFRHVVSFKLAEDKKGEADEMIRQIESLRAIPEVIAIEAGVNTIPSARAFDIVLIADFADRAAYDAYDKSEIHAPVRDYIHSIISNAVAVDYITE